MYQIQKQEKYQFIFFLIILSIIGVLFIFLVPKVRSRIFVQQRSESLNNFLYSTIKNKKVDPQAFWEFREFYSPGYYTFQRTGLNKNQISDILNMTKSEVIKNDNNLYFLHFQSKYLYSMDMLTSATKLSNAVSKIPQGKIVYSDLNTQIISTNNKTLVILFLLPEKQMEKANGFFNYRDPRDIEYVNNRNWLDITYIKMP